ncbi:MAG: LLM class flavin-dependent oxidoreductase [Candidatus Hermodarchaeota archaeon]
MDKKLKYGIYIANYGFTRNPKDYVELAQLGEENGWGGFFLWDHLNPSSTVVFPVIDPWITLAAIAVQTDKIRLGTTVTPLARRRPWKLAREIVSLDHLSNGRFTLGVGLGVPSDAEFESFNENSETKVKAEKLDESLDILRGLWSGKPFSYKGKHYQIKEVTFQPTPIQNSIPIWVGATWPNKKPFQRAAKYNGVFPLRVGFEERLKPSDISDIINYINQYRSKEDPFDVVFPSYSSSKKEENEWIKEYAEVGCTWFFECLDPWRGDLENMKEVVKRGPPTF